MSTSRLLERRQITTPSQIQLSLFRIIKNNNELLRKIFKLLSENKVSGFLNFFNENAILIVNNGVVHVYAITDVTEHSGLRNVCHHIIEKPSNGLLTALFAVLPLQLIAYELALTLISQDTWLIVLLYYNLYLILYKRMILLLLKKKTLLQLRAKEKL